MIDARELRIGNWVYQQGKRLTPLGSDPGNLEPVQITVVTKQSQHKWFPIPLTAEILEKCGFKKENSVWDFSIWLGDIYIFVVVDKDVCWVNFTDYEEQIEIKSVHQLQNFCYVLTGEELPVDLS